ALALRLRHPLGRAAIELGEIHNRLDVRLPRPVCQPPQHHVRFHLPAQCTHVCLLVVNAGTSSRNNADTPKRSMHTVSCTSLGQLLEFQSLHRTAKLTP